MSEPAPTIGVLQRLELYFSLRHTVRTMRQFGEVFERDYDLVMIFLTVAEAGLQAVFHLSAVNAQDVDIETIQRELGSHGLSLLSIGETTGIPRETVRRKLRRLVDMGYLSVRPKDRSFYIPSSAVSNPQILEILNRHVTDVGALVRTIRFYGKDHSET